MANINLISVRRAERLRLDRTARGLVTAVVVTGALGLGAFGFMGTRYLIAQAHVSAANAELQKLRPVLDEIASAEHERTALQPKLVTLTQAEDRTKRWFGIMEGLKRAVPEQTWLTNLSVERQ